MLVQRLELSAEQIEELESLQQDVRTKLDKILTEEQRTQLRELASRRPGESGPGAEGLGFGGERRPGTLNYSGIVRSLCQAA